jgi:hypothetical protein
MISNSSVRMAVAAGIGSRSDGSKKDVRELQNMAVIARADDG